MEEDILGLVIAQTLSKEPSCSISLDQVPVAVDPLPAPLVDLMRNSLDSSLIRALMFKAEIISTTVPVVGARKTSIAQLEVSRNVRRNQECSRETL